MNFFKIVLLLFIFTSSSSQAIAKIYISKTSANEKVYLLNQKSVRVGNGVLSWFSIENDIDLTLLNHFYLCNGKEAKLSINRRTSSILINEGDKGIHNYISSQSLPTGVAPWINIQDTDELKEMGQVACKKVASEDEGYLLPLTQSSYDKTNTSEISALMSGTFLKRGELIEGWLKIYRVFYKKINAVDQKKGRIYFPELKNDGFDLIQISVNCALNKLSLMRLVKYDQGRQVIDDHKYKVDYESPVPDSTSSVIIVNICKIYN